MLWYEPNCGINQNEHVWTAAVGGFKTNAFDLDL